MCYTCCKSGTSVLGSVRNLKYSLRVFVSCTLNFRLSVDGRSSFPLSRIVMCRRSDVINPYRKHLLSRYYFSPIINAFIRIITAVWALALTGWTCPRESENIGTRVRESVKMNIVSDGRTFGWRPRTETENCPERWTGNRPRSDGERRPNQTSTQCVP